MILATLLMMNPAAEAKRLLDPIIVAAGPEVVAVLNDGTTVKGKPKIWAEGFGNIKKLNIKPFDGGKKVKLKAEDVAELRLWPSDAALLASAAATQGSISESLRTNADEVVDREEALYLQGQLPNGKTALLQLLNPGFDQTIQVFPDPKGKETSGVKVAGVQATGGVLKTYLFRKAGETQTMLVKKGKYDNMFTEIYGGCDRMAAPPKIKWSQVGDHIEVHGNMCGPDAGTEEEAAPVEEPAEPATETPEPAEGSEGSEG